jgi:hypothetical protein
MTSLHTWNYTARLPHDAERVQKATVSGGPTALWCADEAVTMDGKWLSSNYFYRRGKAHLLLPERAEKPTARE